MRDLMGMMKKAQELQSKMAEMQAELEDLEVEGLSGAGMVTVKLNGGACNRSARPQAFQAGNPYQPLVRKPSCVPSTWQ